MGRRDAWVLGSYSRARSQSAARSLIEREAGRTVVCLTGTTFTLAAQLQWLDYRHRARHRVTRFSGVVHLNLICISDSTRSDAISPLQRLCFIWPFYWRAIPSPAPMVSRTHESVDLQLGLATHTHTARSTRRYLGLCFDDGHCHDCGGSVSAACRSPKLKDASTWVEFALRALKSC